MSMNVIPMKPGVRYSWNQACCERCWCETQAYGDADPQVGPWRQPVRVKEFREDPEQCAYCGFPTWVGIFVRDDPTQVPYPREEPSE